MLFFCVSVNSLIFWLKYRKKRPGVVGLCCFFVSYFVSRHNFCVVFAVLCGLCRFCVGENDTKKQGTYHCATHFLVSTQTPWSVFVSRNYEKTNFIQHKIFASFSEMEEIDDESIAFEVVSDWIQTNCDEFDPPVKRSRTGRTLKINYWATPWGELLQKPEVKVERSKWGKLFRRRFRVPFALFDKILVPKCREANIFATISEARVRIPLEFKLLMCLRILGRGNVADDIAEMSWAFEYSVTVKGALMPKNKCE